MAILRETKQAVQEAVVLRLFFKNSDNRLRWVLCMEAPAGCAVRVLA